MNTKAKKVAMAMRFDPDIKLIINQGAKSAHLSQAAFIMRCVMKAAPDVIKLSRNELREEIRALKDAFARIASTMDVKVETTE